MEREKRLNHAKHNESLCHYIDANGTFPDWTITTAFYSALHYVCYFIFPLEEDFGDGEEKETIIFKSVEEFKKINGLKDSKHQILSDLVSEMISPISPDYDRLRDLCQTARYHNYLIGNSKAQLAKRLLESIKAGLSIPQ